MEEVCVSPRPAGEADKFGNRYEGRWTIRYLLYVLLGQIDSVTVEEAGDIGTGVEFTVRRGDSLEVHQVKRQSGNANEWSAKALEAVGVLKAARKHVAAGRTFHFVSIVPARRIDELTDRARRTESVQAFLDHMLTKDLRPDFDYLSGDSVFGSVEAAWMTLRGMEVRWPDERDVRDVNSGFAGLLLEGAAPSLATVGLGDLVLDNLNVSLDVTTIERLLDGHGLRRAQLFGSPTLVETVQSSLDRWKDSLARELLQPVIVRGETADIWRRLKGNDRTVFVLGAAGGGKSAVVHETVLEAQAEHWPVLALRLDRLEPFASPVALGQRLDLSVSPVSALAGVSRSGPCLLVIDQLDAVSLVSGRMPESFDVIASLLREASGFTEMRVVLACRKFDVDNDERIRAVVRSDGVSQVEIGPLEAEQVDAAVQAMGLAASSLANGQRTLLSSPLNLVLLRAIADQTNALSFDSSRDLLGAYWERKRRDCRRRRPDARRFNEVIGALVDAMSERQRLAVPMAVLDEDDLADDAQVLESENVLVRDGRQYAFFHETFFDYAFARRWVERRQTLIEFLLGSEQELFRRGQVRQVLAHLHDDDSQRFIEEVEALFMHPDIRFHIKDVVLSMLYALPAPTTAEWDMAKRVIDSQPTFIERLWLMLRTVPWFDRLDAEGKFERWLRGDQSEQNRALEVALGGLKERPDRMAQIIAPYAGLSADYPAWLRWVTRFADLHASRALLDLVIEAVGRGEYAGQSQSLWMSTVNLADHQPAWAVDLLSAYLLYQPGALDLDGSGRVALLESREHAAIELVNKAAEGASAAFCKVMLPYIRKVMSVTEYGITNRPVKDRQFTHKNLANASLNDLEDALLRGARTALRNFVRHDHEAARAVLLDLVADPHETAQWLLYDAMQEAGEAYADWAVVLLLEGDHRLVGSYPSTVTVEAAARLLAAISPHVDLETFAELEQTILRLRVPWERRSTPIGWCMFNLLAALEKSRLSEPAQRRLGELQRLFRADQPPPRRILTGGGIGSPIPPEAARRMSNDQWLRAIAKYNTEQANWTTMRGGAHELSNVLQSEASANPDRFARMTLRLSADTHPSYIDGLLIGFANAQAPGTPDLVFDAIRHIASFGYGEYDRWIGWPLKHHLDASIPDDIIQLLVDRALHSSEDGESWEEEPGDNQNIGERIVSNGVNSARGACADLLGDILIHDFDGHRTSLVAPSLNELASDSSVAVRSCVARLISTCLAHAQPAALDAFQRLIQGDDRLLTSGYVADLIAYIALIDTTIIVPVVRRMLGSEFAEVRKTGGRLAAFMGLEVELAALMESAKTAQDPAAREGVALVCARRLPHTSNPARASTVLQELANDTNEKVREAVAGVAGAVRGQELRPFKEVLISLIDSPSFEPAVDQLLITLEHASDHIDDLIMACALRFVDVFGTDVGNLSTRAARNSDRVGRLILRAYAQARTPAGRSNALDLIDRLLMLAAYRMDELVNAAER
jgi:hypothetical protein